MADPVPSTVVDLEIRVTSTPAGAEAFLALLRNIDPEHLSTRGPYARRTDGRVSYYATLRATLAPLGQRPGPAADA